MSERLLCPPADFELDEAGTARAPALGDVYFSAEGGLAEARSVFLTGTGLPERWKGRHRFTVAELGFGTGLNVLALLDLWRQHRPPAGRLHVVSVEGRPLRREQAEAALMRWPALHDLARLLVAAWPPRYRGAHRRRFDALGVTLTVLHEEAEVALAQADFAADAWFLDGFAPARNPAMWSPAVFAQVARLSAPEARAASFTVAGPVRRGLADVGFSVEKKPGFGRKRERLEATYRSPASSSRSAYRVGPVEGPAVVIGGGIAGAAAADAFRARGRSVKIIAAGGLAAGASGAPAGLMTPSLQATALPHVRALMAAFAYSRWLYDDFEGFHPEGVLRFAVEPYRMDRLRRIAEMLGEGFEIVDARRASELTGIADTPAGIFMPGAGRTEPARIVARLAGATPVVDARVDRLERASDHWRVLDAGGTPIAEAPIVVLAGGADMAELGALYGLPMIPTGGRVVVRELNAASLPRAPVAWGTYVAAAGDAVLVGATHDKSGAAGDADEARAALQGKLRDGLPAFADALGPCRGEWGGIRAGVKDRLPMVGPVADAPGLAVITSFGGRGFTHAPLMAEMVAGDFDGAPAALERDALAVLHPGRFACPISWRGCAWLETTA